MKIRAHIPNLLIVVAFPFPPWCQNLRRTLQNLCEEAFDKQFAKSQILIKPIRYLQMNEGFLQC